MSVPTRVRVVAHTHWDREWHTPFEALRLRLVALVDELLDLLERDPSYTHFLLDGQTQVVDDYLALRPEMESRVRALASAGRLSLGPWAVLTDEFCVSGETIVRNLQRGIARAEELGGLLDVGYLPDMFGHIAQMPQILRLAGITRAALWRGVPFAVRTTRFAWQSLDGSSVDTEYLFGSYANACNVPTTGAGLVQLARDYVEELRDLGDERPSTLLLMNGTDHQRPQPWLGRVVAEANALQDEFEFVVAGRDDAFAPGSIEVSAPWQGELRSSARSNLLTGVASNHVDVHQAAARAELALERLAEPLATFAYPPERYPHAALDRAWQLLIENSAHDSSCACSTDEVVSQVLARYAAAEQIAREITFEAVAALEARAEPGGWSIANPTAHTAPRVVELVVPPGDARPEGAQVVEELAGANRVSVVTGRKLHWVITKLRATSAAGYDTYEAGGMLHVDVQIGAPAIDTGGLVADLERRAAHGGTVRIRFAEAGPQRVLVRTPQLAAFGVVPLRPDAAPAVGVSATHLENEHLRVDVDPQTGTFALTSDGRTWRGLGLIVESGDIGDTYTYCPPLDDVVVDVPAGGEIEAVETGPLRASIAIRAEYPWPTPTVVTTTLSLTSGEPFVRITHAFDNRVPNHRVRVHFPLGAPVDDSFAGCAFGAVERSLRGEGTLAEPPTGCFPARRFVAAGELTLVREGVFEYELVDGGATLAHTLLRGVGMLSGDDLSTRLEPAGPMTPTPAAQLPGPFRCEYALAPRAQARSAADAFALADLVAVPALAVRGTLTEQLAEVAGATVTALRREVDGQVVVRAHGGEHATTLRSDLRGNETDLRGRAGAPFTGERVLRPWEIVQLKLDDGGSTV